MLVILFPSSASESTPTAHGATERTLPYIKKTLPRLCVRTDGLLHALSGCHQHILSESSNSKYEPMHLQMAQITQKKEEKIRSICGYYAVNLELLPMKANCETVFTMRDIIAPVCRTQLNLFPAH